MINLTPLSSIPAFTDALRAELGEYWITSVEEFVSTGRAANSDLGNGLKALSQALSLDENTIFDLYESAQNALPRDWTFDVVAEFSLGLGAVIEGMEVPHSFAFDLPKIDLPPEKKLATNLPAVRYQGQRSTCVAFTLAAMMQQMIGNDTDLSPQFLYWACKERDGIPGDRGTRPDIAMQVLEAVGVCREQTWLYNTEPDPHNPGQGPPPTEAVGEAWLCRIMHTVRMAADNIQDIKTTIASGKSVLLALLVSEHWGNTWQAWNLGRVRQPLPGEGELGGHAVLAIGYKDDPTVPGGGYFVARNSWGTAWGKQNLDGPGHVHIPYQVVYDRNRAAFAIAEIAPISQGTLESEWQAAEESQALSDAAAAAATADIKTLYQEAQEIVGEMQHSLARLDELMARMAGLRSPVSTPANHFLHGRSKEIALVRRHVVTGPLILIDTGAGDSADMLTPNGILAATGQPLLTIDAKSASRIARASAPARNRDDPVYQLHSARVAADQNQHLGTLFGKENDISSAGWAVVVHADEDAALLKALSPLIVKRSADQGLPKPNLEFRDDETCGAWLQRTVGDVNAPLKSQIPVLLYQSNETATEWLARHGTSHGPVNPSLGVPFYLLLAGRPGPIHAGDNVFIPFSVQYELDIFWGLGRLCFTNPQTGQHTLAAYRDYVEQVVAIENAAVDPSRKHIVYFGTHHPPDPATRLSATELVKPLFEGLPNHRSVAETLGFTQELFLGHQATRANLDRILTGKTTEGPPALLFTATHGVGFLVDDPRLTGHQGALICQDWSGFGSTKREHWYAAEDLSLQTRVDGLVAVCFACYGVGCPQEDQFVFTPDQERPVIAPYPLVAQLPQQLLARGALAVLGHVDRAWTHSFRTHEVPAQTQRFESVLGRIMQGDRLGLATDQFNMVQGAIAARLADMLEKIKGGRQMTDLELSTLWVARNDARNYMLLGDPAVRSPFAQ